MGVRKCQWILVQQKVIKKVVRTPQLELLKFVFGIVRGGYNIQWIHPDPALHHFKMQMVAGAVARAAYIERE